jgi:cytochrome oxidase assembly protein ShyY1
MRMPKWIGGLLLALLVAGGFAWLGQWQLSHAVSLNKVSTVDEATVRPLTSVTAPGQAVTDETAGYVFTATGAFVVGDFSVIEQRRNGDEEGAWVVGHFHTDGAPAGGLAVAIGWAADAHSARVALDQLEQRFAGEQLELEGRYMPGDAPVMPAPDQDPGVLLSMAPSQLVNIWQPLEGQSYAGFLVMHPGAELSAEALRESGLEEIESVPPLPVGAINWLNLFYAAEWVVFAGFAIFFWHRLVRDDWEKIHELKLLAAAEAEQAASGREIE